MRINRTFLYVGIFLVALGAVSVAVDLSAVDATSLTDALRLWPLAVVAIGAALVLRRNPQLSLSSGLIAAALPGLLLGGAFAVAPRFAGDCGDRETPAITETQRGVFTGPASISVTAGCGSLTVNTAAGEGWQLGSGNSSGRAPIVRSSPRSLSIQSTNGEAENPFIASRDNWLLTIPTGEVENLALAVNAGQGQVALPGARIGRFNVTANVAEIAIDASSATVENLSGTVHFGVMSIDLPAQADLVGSFRVSGGMLQVCAPPGVGLRVIVSGSPGQLTVEGVEQEGNWQGPDYTTAPHHADLDVHASFGAIEINPIGGCR